MADKKTILIIGFGPGGIAAFNGLKKTKAFPRSTHRIVVAAPAFAYWPLGSLRGAVVPGAEKEVAVTVDPAKMGITADDLYLGGAEVTKLDVSGKVATLDKPRPELGKTRLLGYDYVIIATGSLYQAPMRPPPEVKTAEQAHAFLRDLQGQIADAQNVVIVGSGPVGIEYAGEIATHFGPGKKRITLVSSDPCLFPDPKWKPSLGQKLAQQLSGLKVDVVYNVKVNLAGLNGGRAPAGTKVTLWHHDCSETTLDADYVILAIGNKPNNALFDRPLLDSSGRLKTTPYLTLSSHPSAYAIGDIVDRDGSLKNAATAQAAVVVQNLLVDLTGRGKKVETKDFMTCTVVPLGTKGGVTQLYGMVWQQWITSMIKGDLWTPSFLKSLGLPA